MDTATATEVEPGTPALADLLTETQMILVEFDSMVTAMREGKVSDSEVAVLSDRCAEQMAKIDETIAEILGVTPEYLECLR